MKKILLIIILMIYGIFISNIKSVKSESVIIPKEAIRIRVLANSNDEYDQKIKMKLSIELQKKVQELLKDTKNIEEARIIIKNNLDILNEYINKILKKEHYNNTYKIVYSGAYFPEKNYNGVVYEKGYYESLLVTLGQGKGKNWWCVLFPPLCLIESESNNIEYKLFVQELLKKYF